MSGIPLAPTAASSVWPRFPGSTGTDPSTTGPMPIGGNGLTDLPTVNNPNLPPSAIPTINSLPPPVPQPPSIPFPFLQQPFGPPTSLLSNNYATAQSGRPINGPTPNNYATAQAAAPFNPAATNFGPNPMQTLQTEMNSRRLANLEEENSKRRNTSSTLQQMGQQVLQSQMDMQEQVLQYQFMLDQCIESLDHQNFILNGQSEEIALLQAKMRQFEYLIDAIRQSRDKKSADNHHLFPPHSGDPSCNDQHFLSSHHPLAMRTPSTAPYLIGGVTRITSSKFQPFNPRYRSPTGRSANEPRNAPSSNPNVANSRLSRPVNNSNN